MDTMKKKVYRSQKDKVFAGVLGGLGEYFDIDATILRIVFVAITIFSGILPGLIIYIITIFLMPREIHKERGMQSVVIEMKEPQR